MVCLLPRSKILGLRGIWQKNVSVARTTTLLNIDSRPQHPRTRAPFRQKEHRVCNNPASLPPFIRVISSLRVVHLANRDCTIVGGRVMHRDRFPV